MARNGRQQTACAPMLAAVLLAAVNLCGCIATGQIQSDPALLEAQRVPQRAAAALPPPPAAHRGDCELTWQLSEGERGTLDLAAGCNSEAGLRWFPLGGPRGIAWDTNRGIATYQPDWLEGGEGATQMLLVEGWRDGRRVHRASVQLRVEDTIAPVAPVCVESEGTETHRRFSCILTTDRFLDGPSKMGREVRSTVTLPRGVHAAASLPVRLWLHGLGGSPSVPPSSGIGIAPSDNESTYWWGYGEPDGSGTVVGSVPDYTLRQALVVVQWALRRFPEADANRLSVQGSSMGGSGALQLATHYARHIAWADGPIGLYVPRNHRPARIKTLTKFYGAPGPLALDGNEFSIWDELDVTRQFLLRPETREPFVTTRHGKDDSTIHFGAAVQPSPATGLSFYAALASLRVGSATLWDEGGHGVADPFLPSRWWGTTWDLTTDRTARVALNLAHVAFSRASHDPDPGSMVARDGASWRAEAGFAGDVKVAGDTHWGGAIAGGINRGLRWKTDGIVDTVPQFSVPLRLIDEGGEPSPGAGYPCLGSRVCAELPVVVDVTPRRTQAFRFAAGEAFVWRSGGQRGSGRANADGEVTAERVEVTTVWQTLAIRRVWPDESAEQLLRDGWAE